MKFLLEFLLVSVITVSHLPPPSLAFRIGAPVESCYDHFIDPGSDNHPDVTILPCDDSVSCTYDLRVTEVVNETTLELGSDTTTYECGRIYGIELIASLNPTRGFLVQVRSGTNSSSAIIGTFLDPNIANARTGDTINYQILSCKRSRHATDGQLFPNSATQINAADKLGTLQFYWIAPQCNEYDMIVNVTIWFTIVQTLDLARGPGMRPMLSYNFLPTTVPSTTVPSTTVPPTTVPFTTVPSTTVPPTTVVEVPVTTTRSSETKSAAVILTLTPSSGHMLGGTGVIITGPCFKDKIVKCIFDGVKVRNNNIIIISNSLLLCVTPQMTRTGSVSVEVEVDDARYNSTFISLSPERAHSVNFDPGDLLLDQDGKDTRTLTWSPETIVPSYLLPNTTTEISVAITILRQQVTSFQSPIQVVWTPVHKMTNLPNNGVANIVIPKPGMFTCDYPLNRDVNFHVCPVIFRVSYFSHTPQSSLGLSRDLGQWSGIAFWRLNEGNDEQFRFACEQWSTSEPQNVKDILQRLNDLIPCPPTIRLARLDPNYHEVLFRATNGDETYHKEAMRFFHMQSQSCFNELIPQIGQSGQECCYNDKGFLVKGEPSGGSADYMSPRVDYNAHIITDLAPYVLCCVGSKSNCNAYFSERPGGNETDYELPIPACVYGDPHIVTLDGLKYTFNGKGEFILIETNDNTFTLQGRMVPAKDADDSDALGTVFSAIVAIQHQTDTIIQFEIIFSDIRVTVNNVQIDFDETSEVQLDDVILEDKGNKTISAGFSQGASIELKLENGIISVMLVTLSAYQKGMTQGLMGNFNGDPNDDLIPKGETDSLPPDASIEDIHNIFGITWIISDQSMSSFTYRSGNDYTTFYDPSFTPVFEPQFNDDAFQQEAKEVCGEDRFCLFDIAATRRVDIGKSTMQGSVNFQEIINSSQPIVCDPECVNGACVENDTCSCSEGYIGDRCTTKVMSECTENVCQNNGTCTKHVLTVTCTCPPGYIGAFCQEKEPPFHVNLINGSPRVTADTVAIEFVSSKPMTSATCYLSEHEKHDCTSGRVHYTGLKSSSYIFRLVTKSQLGERHVFRRIINVIGSDGMIGSGLDVSNDLSCAVNLINEGITVDGTTVIAQFVGVGVASSFQCQIDKQPFKHCRSPFKYTGLEPGRHRMQVLPQGSGCTIQKKLSQKFQVP